MKNLTPAILIEIRRHPASAVAFGLLFAIAAAIFVRGGLAAQARLVAADDPVAVTDQALAATFDRDVAEREIRDALAASDLDLAQSFLDLAADRGISVDVALSEKVKGARSDAASAVSRRRSMSAIQATCRAARHSSSLSMSDPGASLTI